MKLAKHMEAIFVAAVLSLCAMTYVAGNSNTVADNAHTSSMQQSN